MRSSDLPQAEKVCPLSPGSPQIYGQVSISFWDAQNLVADSKGTVSSRDGLYLGD